MMRRSARLRGFLRTVADRRGRQGRSYPLEYLLALPLIAGMAGDGELDAAAEWAATAPEELLVRLGAPLGRNGKARRPDATTLGRALAGADQAQYDDALCAWSAARARALRPGMRRHLRIDGKAVRGAARGGRAPMLLSGIWDDGTTAAQLPVDVRKTNEIPVFRQLLKKIPDLAGAVITADQMHTQRKHARAIDAAGAFFLFTIGENQPLLFDAAGALPWESVAGEAWTVDRGHGRVDVRTIKTLPPTERISALFPHVRQVFLVERYSYGTGGEPLAPSPSSASPACRRTRPAPPTCSLTSASTGPSRIARQSAPMSSQRADRGSIIGREGLLRLVEVVERLRARECGRDVSSWTREEGTAPNPGAGDGSAVGGPAGGQSAGGGALARGDRGQGGAGGESGCGPGSAGRCGR